MTLGELQTTTRKELAILAKHHHVAGWHGMRKAQLIDALTNVFRTQKRKSTPSKQVDRGLGSHRPELTTMNRKTRGVDVVTRKNNGIKKSNGIQKARLNRNGRPSPARSRGRVKTVEYSPALRLRPDPAASHDSIKAEPISTHWLHVSWTLTKNMLDRAESSLGYSWHDAVPVIRVFDVSEDINGEGQENWVADVAIAARVDDWYVPIENPQRAYRLCLGLKASDGRFFALARTSRVTLSRLAAATRRPAATNGRHSMVANHQNHKFEVEADILIHGSARPGSKLTILGEPVEMDVDGTFELRVTLDGSRQIIPAVVIDPMGLEQQTIVLAIERNKKELEPKPLTEW